MTNPQSPALPQQDNLLMKITKVLRSLWVFGAAIIVHTIVILAFWQLPQGRDVVSCASESWKQILTSGLAVVFWSFVTWYCSRLMAYARHDVYQEEVNQMKDSTKKGVIRPIWQVAPRLLGYLCYTIAIVMVLRMSRMPQSSPWIAVAVMSVSVFLFFAFRSRLENLKWDFQHHYKRHMMWIGITFLLVIITPALYKRIFDSGLTEGVVVTCGCLLLGQWLFLLVVTHRKKWLMAWESDGHIDNRSAKTMSSRVKRPLLWLNEKILLAVNGKQPHPEIDKQRPAEVRFLFYYNTLTLVCIIIFILAFSYPRMARAIGSLAIVMLGLTLIQGACNIISIISIYKKVKLYFIALVIALVSGWLWEPHKMKIENLKEENGYTKRQNVAEYLNHWMEAHKAEFGDSTKVVPMYYVLANGGASRSGYWVANVLNRLDEQTNNQFSDHLFCLSGASGGSVGNAAFFAQLKEKYQGDNRLTEARNYLGSDFLSYTAAKMLGPDVLNFTFSGFHFHDRARGLQQSMEYTVHAPELSKAFARPFSRYATRQGEPSPLPILFINTTRMQDGKPGVFSTISMKTLNTSRIDVASQLPETKDITLAGAVVNGARFPYISPGGALCDKRGHWQYFVDGGYFDNSGAGIVHELIQEVDSLLKHDVAYAGLRERIVMRIVHITNSEWSSHPNSKDLGAVPTIKNDLAAPFITLLGSYSMQTSVNDYRLVTYVESMPGEGLHYLRFPLLNADEDGAQFTMNWVISRYVRYKMDARLDSLPYQDASKTILKDFGL